MTVKELLKYVVCNVEVWKPIEGVKIWNFDRRCVKKVDINEYNDAEVYNYKFFTKNEYIEYLLKIEKHVMQNKPQERTYHRKYVGILTEINGFKYFVPMSSPKDKDYENGKSKRIILL